MEQSPFKSFIKNNMMWLILIGIMIIFAILSPNFRSFKNIMNILTQNAYFIITTIGIAVIMISGGTDLSVGHILATAGICTALILQSGIPTVVAIILGIVAGLVVATILGAFNGLMANTLKIHSMIVTLATMTMFQGIAFIISQSKSYYNFPAGYLTIGQGYVGPISIPVIITIIVILVIHFILSKTCFGRFIYAVGGNPETARLAGINVSKIKLMAFGLGGILFGIASIVLTSRGGSASANLAPSIAFDGITACVLGGVSFIGGAGKVADAVAGCLVLGVLSNGMQMVGMGVNTQYVIKGAILLLAIGYDTFQRSRQAKAKKTA